jgi:hypothetical protein
MSARAEMIAVLHEARELLGRPDNDFTWSSWEDAPAARAEIDDLLSRLLAGDIPMQGALAILFAPTGPMQEVSLSSGWGDEFCALADRYDAVQARFYGD